ncbi:hypothetical protein Tco_0805976 [Tanacetum coccineum]
MQQSFIHEYNDNLVFKVELAKKEHMVEKKILDEVVLRCSRLENRAVNLELKLQHQKETKLDAKDVSIAKLKKHIENLKEKNVIENDVPSNKAKVIAPRMFKLDLEPLAPKVLKNMDAHIDYIKHAREHADTLCEIVEHARALRPLDSDLDSACNNKKKDKVEDHPRIAKSRLNNKNRVIKPVCNADVKHTTLNANSKLLCAKCNQCMFNANDDVCFLEFLNDVNVHSKSNMLRGAKRKPTGKVFTDIGYRWKSTGRTFTIVGNSCPLTRITSTKVEPLKETTLKSVTTPNLEIKIYRRKIKVAKSIDLSSETRILGSRPTNISEPNKHWGSTALNSPSSLVNFRLSRLFSGIWTPDIPSI